MTPTFAATVRNKNVVVTDRQQYVQYLAGLEGKDVLVSITEPKRQRSNNQNAYYFGVLLEVLREHLGYRVDEKTALHEALKSKFLKKDGLIAKSTKNLSTVEMEDYLRDIRMWASSELDCYIPKPNEVS